MPAFSRRSIIRRTNSRFQPPHRFFYLLCEEPSHSRAATYYHDYLQLHELLDDVDMRAMIWAHECKSLEAI